MHAVNVESAQWGTLFALVALRLAINNNSNGSVVASDSDESLLSFTTSIIAICILLPTLALSIPRQWQLSAFALPALLGAMFLFAPSHRMRAEIAACALGTALVQCVRFPLLLFLFSSLLLSLFALGDGFYSLSLLLQSAIVALANCAALRLFRTFSDSFSIAELHALSQMLAIVVVRAAFLTSHALAELGDASRDLYWTRATTRVEILLYAVAVGMLFIVVGCVPLLSARRPLAALAWTVLVLAVVVSPLTSRIMRVNCWLWTVENILAPRHRVLLVTWLALVLLALMAPRNATLVPLTVRRKYFHLIALVALVPPALMRSSDDNAPGLLTSASSSAMGRLASGVALAALCALELLRFGRVMPSIDVFMRSFVDARDCGRLIVTHIYLLIGCAAPLWIDSRFDIHPMAAFAGLLIIGIGDAAASTFGAYFGRHKWPLAEPKSIEGTAGCFVATMLSAWALNCIFMARGLPHIDGAEPWARFALATAYVSVMEAYSRSVDNLILPIAYLLALFAMGCV